MLEEYCQARGMENAKIKSYQDDINGTLRSKIQDLRKIFKMMKNKLRDSGKPVDEDFIIDEYTIEYYNAMTE